MSLTFKERLSLLFLAAVMIFPQSFVVFKLALLLAFLAAHTIHFIYEKKVYIHFRILCFYLFIAGMGFVWSVVGLINDGELAGVIDSLRLYVLWSMAFFIIFNYLLMGNAFLVFHKAIVASGIIISGLNIFAVYNQVAQLGIIPEAFISELDMLIGFHEGYIQITSINIGSLFFIAAYLITVQFRKDMNVFNSRYAKISLFMCLILIILSGRRALWISISIAPFLIILFSLLTNSLSQIRGLKWLLFITFLGFIPVFVVLSFLISGDLVSNSSLSHLQEAFSSADERSIQKWYLIEGFKNNPIMGSGFGAYAGYLRSANSPWLYELTYHQMLFNFGLVGVSLLFCLMAAYFRYAVAFISQRNECSGIAFCLLIAITILAVAAYSNPYFGSFDFLLLIGVLPLISASSNVKIYNSPKPNYICE